MDVLDMNSGQIVRTYSDLHTRTAHVIKQNLVSVECGVTKNFDFIGQLRVR